MLQFAAICCCSLLITAICCYCYHNASRSYEPLFAAICCYLLLFAAICYNLLLFAAIYCNLLLFVAICCYVLLFAVICCYELLFAASCCNLLLFAAIFKRSFDSVRMNSASHLDNLAQAPIGLHCTGQSPLHLRGLGHVTIEALKKRQFKLSFVLVL